MQLHASRYYVLTHFFVGLGQIGRNIFLKLGGFRDIFFEVWALLWHKVPLGLSI